MKKLFYWIEDWMEGCRRNKLRHMANAVTSIISREYNKLYLKNLFDNFSADEYRTRQQIRLENKDKLKSELVVSISKELFLLTCPKGVSADDWSHPDHPLSPEAQLYIAYVHKKAHEIVRSLDDLNRDWDKVRIS